MSKTKTEQWPVIELTFEMKDKSGWQPNDVEVPQGAEVRLSLANNSTAPAAFEIVDIENKKFIKECLVVRPGEKQDVVFFANYKAGEYAIRNSWEQQPEGKFRII